MSHRYRNKFQRIFNDVADRIAPPDVQATDSLMYWRARILATILMSGLGLTILAFVASVLLAAKNEVWQLVWINGTGYLLVVDDIDDQRRIAANILMRLEQHPK